MALLVGFIEVIVELFYGILKIVKSKGMFVGFIAGDSF